MTTVIEISKLGEILRKESLPMKARNRALFGLRAVTDIELSKLAIQEINSTFKDNSALLKHECAYCLGQMTSRNAVPLLIDVLHDVGQEVIVRHEAGEALGAIGDPTAIEHLQKHITDTSKPLSETCIIAIDRINFYQKQKTEKIEFKDNNPFLSVDPAPPWLEGNCEKWRETLLDANQTLFDRYRSLFSLRNEGTDSCVLAICEAFNDKSILLRHEIAYVLGQLQNKLSIPALQSHLSDLTENYMVRHESAEALGSIADLQCREILTAYLQDSDQCVRESCEVALDISDYVTSGELSYAN
ncbi:Deoxyhypusine hydroxylase [Oopsacas minuta]|uniref:Deoxyhypusine hydroxylase n=1 Tax=Oopsacas minuta TaxID=111878 RepID=A0AAV7JFP9_9METZ|nr:Deoxyhypusine hydroxylase [Oopsacas minuta]